MHLNFTKEIFDKNRQNVPSFPHFPYIPTLHLYKFINLYTLSLPSLHPSPPSLPSISPLYLPTLPLPSLLKTYTKLHREIDRKDLAVQMRKKIGDYSKVVDLLRTGGGVQRIVF